MADAYYEKLPVDEIVNNLCDQVGTLHDAFEHLVLAMQGFQEYQALSVMPLKCLDQAQVTLAAAGQRPRLAAA